MPDNNWYIKKHINTKAALALLRIFTEQCNVDNKVYYTIRVVENTIDNNSTLIYIYVIIKIILNFKSL